MNERRVKGLEKEISRKIGNILLTEIKNEKLKNLVTVYEVKLSKDGRYADITFSVLNYKQNINKEKVLEDLNKVKGYFRKRLSEELTIRYVPEIRVHLDDSVEYAVKISNLIDEVLDKK
ncbi:30S ribosome-binding factor RbfA [Oceanivirga salmonicida]|uniref:30S ribosome-binding factor RbfA n=1 Tax=Oceanivirga salmonicida TaxID=1769291 RepID=UPI000832099B|nr:30S ribosome-binding factor RbfA [Oceanivirga salmonicida]